MPAVFSNAQVHLDDRVAARIMTSEGTYVGLVPEEGDKERATNCTVNQLNRFKIVYQPRLLRHFTYHFEPLAQKKPGNSRVSNAQINCSVLRFY